MPASASIPHSVKRPLKLRFTPVSVLIKDYVSFVHSLYQKDFSEQQFASLAEAFHFSKYINRRISELSLGNRQKVVLMTGLLQGLGQTGKLLL